MRPLLFPLLCSCLLALPGCPADLEVPPAFVTLDDLALSTVDGQGAATSSVNEVWVFVGGDLQGIYPLPGRIPLHFSGSTAVEFRAGIRENGVSATPNFYEFYEPIVRTLELVPGETTPLGVLPLRYDPAARFALIEDYETTEANFRSPILGQAVVVPQGDIVRSGNASGRLRLTTDSPVVEIASRAITDPLLANRPLVYLELDFLSEAPGQFGVSGIRNGELIRRFDPAFNPRDRWTKIYFDLTPITVSADLNELLLVLSALLPQGAQEADVYLDNIKVLYF